MKKQSTTIISIILLILIAIFALLNTATVEVNLLGLHVRMPLVLLIFVCLLIGAVIIYLLSFSTHLKTSKELKELKASKISKAELENYQKKINKLQKENTSLRQQLKEQPKSVTNTK
ncbi:DUF1049 domain-containing protein [Lactobacillus sp. 0.1XD8-4]|uniref:DUF1049 domain-containing protein n=1 Tax=Limosilactobacillus walteri TaxID=2268022 RepID=A0ABR8P665_9LACO|nr:MULTISPECIES: lipopolysaccharide assembly protein LapA domain-containing protein [Lactobacillaceae]MBD5806220.1 DUF1049 domain-containing protein [Limosilactobacillus walteri]MRN07809.1 DUF1049 domain-containing protein [Lactobacillus sp. 0.1XD8-4]